MAVYWSPVLFFFLTTLPISTSCDPCFTFCITKPSDSLAETCPVNCDQQKSKDLGSLDTSTFQLTVGATNSCEVDYEVVLASEDTRISIEPEKTAGKTSVETREQQVDIQCTNLLNFAARVIVNVTVFTSTNGQHEYLMALERTCGTETGTETVTVSPTDTSKSSTLSSKDVLIIITCSVIGGIMIIIIALLTAIYLRKQTVSPESGSEAVETLGRRVKMRFSNAIPLNEGEEETQFYQPITSPIVIIPHELEFPFDHLGNLESIGQTTFGVLYRSNARDMVEGQACTDVLVRMLRDDVDREVTRGFLKQVEKIASLVHDNIVQLLGVCSREIQPCMIFECPDGGNLNDILRSNSNSNLKDSDLITFALQVADAMAFLEFRGFVHRDLSTRNCLLTKTMQIKLLPFGVIRPDDVDDYYKVGHQTMLPVRWLPHDTILHGQFNAQTDVWSFGVFLWELFSRGKQPFEGRTNDEVVKSLREGVRLQCPKSCPRDIYELMVQCWMENPTSRPTFCSLHAAIRLIQL